MGFCNASCSFTRFRIIDPIPSELWTQIPDKLRQFAFRDIDDLPEMQAYGWVCFEDMLDSEWRTAPHIKEPTCSFLCAWIPGASRPLSLKSI
ncbi:hypothetical protein DESPIG_01246 [Desulfovibrio piger ATCC 29098]|uniref:Uncharacterized protein n=1 Tax=Desulfovibrio piger ATCC 29098 TaxID=411464 RepID=B6WT42_9BACT|nr:hypothetical protein DESPIG_01246 [Desulfovibrio piger ATCC 29098]